MIEADHLAAAKYIDARRRWMTRDDLAFLSAKLRHSIEEQLICWGGIQSGLIDTQWLRRTCEHAVEDRNTKECQEEAAKALAWDVCCEVCAALSIRVPGTEAP